MSGLSAPQLAILTESMELKIIRENTVPERCIVLYEVETDFNGFETGGIRCYSVASEYEKIIYNKPDLVFIAEPKWREEGTTLLKTG